MAENNIKVENNVDETGRRVQTRVFETVVDGKRERVVETHVEQIPMVIKERVVENIAPVVTSRKKETYKDGKVIDSVVEELDHGTMKMSAAKPQDNALTREDLLSIIREVLATRDVSSSKPETEGEAPVPAVKKKLMKVAESATASVPTKIWETVEIGAFVILSGELAFCLYQLVLKNWL